MRRRSLICTGARRNPATCGTNPDNGRRQSDATLRSKAENRGVVVTEAGWHLRLIDSCSTQLKSQGPSRICNESKEEEEEDSEVWWGHRCRGRGCWPTTSSEPSRTCVLSSSRSASEQRANILQRKFRTGNGWSQGQTGLFVPSSLHSLQFATRDYPGNPIHMSIIGLCWQTRQMCLSATRSAGSVRDQLPTFGVFPGQ